jgi:hypothetical protein
MQPAWLTMCHYINYNTHKHPLPHKKRGHKENGKITYKGLHNLSFSPHTVRKIGGWTEHGA